MQKTHNPTTRHTDRKEVRVGRYLIYGLLDPRDKSLRYIGKTHKRRELRLAEHIEDAGLGKGRPLHVWIRELLEQDLQPQIFVLRRVPPSESWGIAEREEISKWRALRSKQLPLVHPPQTPKSQEVVIHQVNLTNVQNGG